VAPAGGNARLVYFLTAASYNRARDENSALRAGRPGIRSSTLMEHGLACADVALAYRRLARSRPGHEVLEWECDWQAAEPLGSTVVVPDAHLSYATASDTLEAFIEIDRATEGSRSSAQGPALSRALLVRQLAPAPQRVAYRLHRHDELDAGEAAEARN